MNIIMHAGVQFNRRIDRGKDFVYTGSYELMFAGKPVRFDFADVSMSIDKRDPSILHITGERLDTESFPESSRLTSEMLCQVTGIEEVNLEAETIDGSEPLHPERIVDAGFLTEDGVMICVPPEVLSTAVFEDRREVRHEH